MLNLHIARAAAAHIEPVAALYDTLNDYLASHVNYPGWIKGVYPTGEEARHFCGEGALFVAQIGGALAGSFALTHEPEAEPVKGKWRIDAGQDQVLALHVFAVHPDFMGRGVASAMLAFACDIGVKTGAKAIRLDVYEKNLPAIGAYEKAGFQYIDTVDLGLGHHGLDWFRLYEKVLA